MVYHQIQLLYITHVRKHARTHNTHAYTYHFIITSVMSVWILCLLVISLKRLITLLDPSNIIQLLLIERSFIKITNVLRRNDLPFSIFKAHVSKHLVQFFILRNLITDNENVLKNNNNTYNYVTIIS